MGKYAPDAKRLYELVGGTGNIVSVSHCVTRMRFVLNDPSKADVPAIEALESVKGSFTQGGQFQVVIGNGVKEFYDDFMPLIPTRDAHADDAASDDAGKTEGQKRNALQRAMAAVAETFAPLIPAIIVGGLMLGLGELIDSVAFLDGGTATLAQTSQIWLDVDGILRTVAEAILRLGIPVGVCWSVTKKLGGTPILGIVLGLTLVSGGLLGDSGASAVATETTGWGHVLAQTGAIACQGQVIPAALSGIALGLLERLFRKITPQAASMIVVPFASLLLAAAAAHLALAPIGLLIGSGLSAVVHAGLTGPAGALLGGGVGLLFAPLALTGLHHVSILIDLQLVADFGGTMLWPMIALSNIAQGSAVLGMLWLQRRDERARQTDVPALISCYLGVTEPAVFGINLKFAFPFLCAMAGSCVAGAVCVASGVTANAIGVGGIPGLLSIKPASIPAFFVCMALSVCIPFVLTLVFGKIRGIGTGSGANISQGGFLSRIAGLSGSGR